MTLSGSIHHDKHDIISLGILIMYFLSDCSANTHLHGLFVVRYIIAPVAINHN